MKKQKNILSVMFISSATVIGGLLSYLYHPLMIRYLSIEEFGTFESILSVLNLLWVFIAAIGLFYVKEVSKNISNLEYSKSYRILSLRYLFLLSIGITILYFATIPFISSYLNIPYYYFLILGFTIVFSFISITNTAFLQSLHKFPTISGLIIGGGAIKLVTGFLFVYLGFNIFGALGGFIASQTIVFLIGYLVLGNYFKEIRSKTIRKKDVLITFTSQKKQILQYLFTSILIALLMNIDILIVKNMFGGETAGYYAAVSVLAKFLVFLGLSIETVYYPQLVKGKIFPTKQILKISMYYIAMLVGALGFFHIFGETMLRLFKEGLEEYIGVIFPLLVYCGLLGYISIIVKTLIAFEKYVVNYILSIVIIGIIVCIYMFADDIYSLTYIFMYGSIIGLIVSIITMIASSGEKK